MEKPSETNPNAARVNGPARIVIVTPDIVGPVKNGGIGTACFHYARSLANAGLSVDILFSGDVSEADYKHWYDWYRKLSINFYTLQQTPTVDIVTYGSRWYAIRAQRVFGFLRARDYDYILFQDWHANSLWASRAKRMGLAFANTKIGVISHSPNQWQKAGMQSFGQDPFEESGLEWSEEESIANADALISPSKHMVQWLRDHNYRLPAEVTICPYTFEDPVKQGSPGQVDRSHLIFFGRLETRKGLHLFGAALRQLKAAGKPMPNRISLLGKHAEVCGEKSQDYIERLKSDLPKVKFFVETDFDYAQAVNYIKQQNGIVVLPSILDNYPLTVIESITNGFCFIASDAGGIPEMIDSKICFRASAEGLRAMLEELPDIDFKTLVHPYNPDGARQTWLEHVKSSVESLKEPQNRVDVRDVAPPPVSVCIPFYKHDAYINRLVGSFLRMGLPNMQLVVVDDGTPVNERENFDRLRETLASTEHVFVSQRNAGPGAARNKSVSLAKHDNILFFDADNVPFPDMVRKLGIALKTSGADSIVAPYLAVPSLKRAPLKEETTFCFHPQGGPTTLALIDNVVGDVCSIIRRRVFDAVGGFTETRGSWEDWEFFMRVVAKGFKHTVYPDPLFYYTVDERGRHLQANGYANRMSLMSTMHHMPAHVLAQMARTLALQHIVRAS